MRNKMMTLTLTIAVFFGANSSYGRAKLDRGVKRLSLDDQKIATIRVSPNGTVLSFPTKPKKVILGRKKSFDVEYVDNDVAIAPLSSSASSNMFVYLLGRRYAFRLLVVPRGGDEIVLVRDAPGKKIHVRIK